MLRESLFVTAPPSPLSSVLDIVDYVKREGIKILIDHLVEHFGHRCVS